MARLARAVPEEDVARVLGFGAVLSAFSGAPADPLPAARDELEALGARFNLLVATFDQLIDGGAPPGRVLPRSVVWTECRGWTGLSRLATVSWPAERRLLARLLRDYLAGMEALGARGLREELLPSFRRWILRMYDAEIRTLGGRRHSLGAPGRAQRVKGTWPFVMLGAPSWLAAGHPSCSLRKHLAWLLRLGGYLSTLDDAVDAEEDQERGLENLLLRRRRKAGLSDAGDAIVTGAIVEEGRRVLRDWAGMAGAGPFSPEVQRSVELCTVSWLGGAESVARYGVPGW